MKAKKNFNSIVIIMISIILIVVVGVSVFLLGSIDNVLFAERQQSLIDTTQASAKTVKQAVDSKWEMVRVLTDVVEHYIDESGNIEKLQESIKNILPTNNDQFFLVDTSGKYYCSDGYNGVVSEVEYFTDSSEKELEYLGTLPHKEKDTNYMILRSRLNSQVTIKVNGANVTIAYCALMYNLSELNNTISTLFEGSNNTIIYEASTGNMLYTKFSMGMLIEGFNVYSKMNDVTFINGDATNTVIQNCKNGENVVAEMVIDGVNYYISSASLQMRDWSLLFVIKSNYITNNSENGFRVITYSIFSVAIAFGIAVILVVIILFRNKINKEKTRNQSIINGLSGDYNYVFYIDAKQNTITDIYIDELFKSIYRDIDKSLPSNIRLDKLLHKLMLPDEMESFRKETNRKKLMEQLEEAGHVEIKFRAIVKYKMLYYSLRMALDENNPDGIIAGLCNVDYITKRENEVKESKIEAENSAGLIKKFTEGYSSVYIVDLNNDSFEVVKRSKEKEKQYGRNIPFSLFMDRYIEDSVFEDDKRKFAETVNIRNIKGEINKQDSFSLRYHVIENEFSRWYELVISKLDESHVLIGFEDNHEDIIKEIVSNTLADDIIASYYLNLKTNTITLVKKSEIFGEDQKDVDRLDVIIKKSFNLVDDEYKAGWKEFVDVEKIKRTLSKDDRCEFIFTTHKFGEQLWLKCTVYVVDKTDGVPIRLVATYNNVDKEQIEKLRAEKEKHEREIVIDALALDFDIVGHIVFCDDKLDDQAEIVEVNENVKKYAPEILRESKFTKMLDAFCKVLVVENERDLFIASTRRETIIEHIQRDGVYAINIKTVWGSEEKYYQIKFIGTQKDGTGKYLSMVSGIHCIDSEIKREKIIQDQLNDALNMAQSSNRAKTVFLNSMSHDIRTPMNAIIGFNERAMKVSKEKEVLDYLKKMSQASEHLLSLINDVLDMSRIESGRITLNEKPEDLKDLMDRIRNIVSSGIEAKNLKFILDMENIQNQYVVCDRLRLNQILLNILSNAQKYTKEGTIKFTVTQKPCGKKNYAKYEFVISDTGIGMSSDFVKTIFEPFTREETSTVSGIQGSGLGMTITKNLIEYFGGTIDVFSEQGKGTTFVLVLDFELTDETNVVKPEVIINTKNNNAGKKVLLVEDNDLNTEIATELLEDEGITVLHATNGQEAVDMVSGAKVGDIDLILMDIQMPIMNGYVATENIRQLKNGLENIPIIAMTANAFAEDKQAAIDAGMNDHLSKPINVEKFNDMLNRFI